MKKMFRKTSPTCTKSGNTVKTRHGQGRFTKEAVPKCQILEQLP
jgi:hypothetical protein